MVYLSIGRSFFVKNPRPRLPEPLEWSIIVAVQLLYILFTGLSVFGVGVTLVDFFGVLEHAAGQDATAGGQDDGDEALSDDDGADGHDDSLADDDGDVGHDDSYTDDGGDDSPVDADDTQDDNDEPLAEQAEASHETRPLDQAISMSAKSALLQGDDRARAVAKALSWLRNGVYFSLGAGPTGLFALLTGQTPISSLAWSGGTGILIAVAARLIRRAMRKDLDSSMEPFDFLEETGELDLPMPIGAIGKLRIKKYGAYRELYVKSAKPDSSFAKGEKVKVSSYDKEFYYIEKI